jgi:hypothetical protein
MHEIIRTFGTGKRIYPQRSAFKNSRLPLAATGLVLPCVLCCRLGKCPAASAVTGLGVVQPFTVGIRRTSDFADHRPKAA